MHTWKSSRATAEASLNFTFCIVKGFWFGVSTPSAAYYFISYRPLARFPLKRVRQQWLVRPLSKIYKTNHSQNLGWGEFFQLFQNSMTSVFSSNKNSRTKVGTEISSSNRSDKWRFLHGKKTLCLSVWGSWCLWSFALVACWFSTSWHSWMILAWYHGWPTRDLRSYQKPWCSDDWFLPRCLEDYPMTISG